MDNRLIRCSEIESLQGSVPPQDDPAAVTGHVHVRVRVLEDVASAASRVYLGRLGNAHLARKGLIQMAITALKVEGYRSIRQVELKLRPINVLVGPNGVGKTNLYRSMFLLAAAAGGQLARTVVEEGGMPSVLWAGPRKKGVVRMILSVTVDQLTYELACGLATPPGFVTASEPSMFLLDPEVKEERVWFTERKSSKTPLLERNGGSVWARDAEGRRVTYPMVLSNAESVLSQLREPHRFPHLSALRQELLGWRFYHHFRTDAEAPLRHPQVGVRTPILSHDGSDLAAALQTIREVGDRVGLEEAVDQAFPGASLRIESPRGRFSVLLHMPGFHAPFDARELSDGTLRYLCLLAALMSPRPPSVLALNEPETSIHPDLLEPLAHLIHRASKSSQLWITTHSEPLAERIATRFAGTRLSGAAPVRLEKVDGETRIVGQRLLD